MINFELVGYIAGFIVAISLTPQVVKAWKTKSTKDISVAWTLIYIIGLVGWIIYGFGIQSFPLMITVTIEILLAVSLLILKVRYSWSLNLASPTSECWGKYKSPLKRVFEMLEIFKISIFSSLRVLAFLPVFQREFLELSAFFWFSSLFPL